MGVPSNTQFPREELALGNLTEKESVMWRGAKGSDKFVAQNKNQLGPLSPGAQVTQSIFQEARILLFCWKTSFGLFCCSF